MGPSRTSCISCVRFFFQELQIVISLCVLYVHANPALKEQFAFYKPYID